MVPPRHAHRSVRGQGYRATRPRGYAGLILLSLLLVIAVVTGPLVTGSVLAERQPERSSEPTLVMADGPRLTARASYAVDVTHGVELWAARADESLAPASTAKMLTALVVRRILQEDETIRIEPSDLVDPTIYANASLQPGDEVTVRGLLAALLIASAGDAARALARVGGMRLDGNAADPRAVFVAAMNTEARRLGLRTSWFLTPDGRDAPGQGTTARELAIVAAALLTDPLLSSLVATPRFELAIGGVSPRTVTLLNTNELLGWNGVIGVKTGTSLAAGQCLVLALRRGGALVIAVLLGSSDRYTDARQLVSWLDRHYRWIPLDASAFPELAALAGSGIVPAVSPTILVPSAAADQVSIEIERRAGPARWVAGTVRLRNGTEELVAVPLIRLDRLELPSANRDADG